MRSPTACRALTGALVLWWIGAAPIISISALAGHGVEASVPTVRSEYVKRLLDAGAAIVFVDLRSLVAFEAGHLAGALPLPMSELARRLGEIPRSGRVIIYCDCSLEVASSAAMLLSRHGYRNHAVMEDGFAGWLRLGYPVVR